MPDAIATPSPDPSTGSLGAVVDLFRAGTALVDAALAALTRVAVEIETMRDMIRRDVAVERIETSVSLLRWHLDAATVGGDNLLVAAASPIAAKPLVIFAVSRSATGALTTQTIAVERGPLILARAEPGPSTAFDRLDAALRCRPPGATRVDPVRLTRDLDDLSVRVGAATSRLSVIKVRLDLQSSFVTAVADADTAPPVVRLDSHVNHAGARDLALETRRLLSRQSLGIGTSNRQVLQTLFERHGS